MPAAEASRRPGWARLPALRGLSLRGQLLWGILLPVGLFIVVNTVVLYEQALSAVNTAYDRTLLASAKSIGEQLEVRGFDDHARIHATVPYSALEVFEADTRSQLFYRVSDLDGALVSGFGELPFWQGQLPARPPYAALVDFYDARFRDRDVRVAVLLQPVASGQGRGMAVVQVAETLELRHDLARQILVDTLVRQAVLVVVIGLVVVAVVQGATRPVRRLSTELQGRAEGDLAPLQAPDAPRELQPLVEATNQLMRRLRHLLAHQKRFVRDTAHQLRTPLAVLKVQVQSAQRGDVPPAQAYAEIGDTVDRATRLANQMLTLAKVEQLRQQPETRWIDVAEVLREVALDLSPLIAAKDLEFSLDTAPVWHQGHDWMWRELARNLLHNAIKHSPTHAPLLITLRGDGPQGLLCVRDAGPGISEALRTRLFQPFSAGDVRSGSGLGLAICQEIVQALGGRITLDTVAADAAGPAGLVAQVRWPLSAPGPDGKGTMPA